MRDSQRFFNFAASISIVAVLLLSSCKGRTAENMEPTGDTIEVIVAQPQEDETQI